MKGDLDLNVTLMALVRLPWDIRGLEAYKKSGTGLLVAAVIVIARSWERPEARELSEGGRGRQGGLIGRGGKGQEGLVVGRSLG
ncbi:hypothetical protein E2C01_073289 [Portunus trituberculatus]|uniref:Uncharacterized protein n=1 Tax=Portunus trituberculatus TaxID=210409 RepID=A0A5B7I4T9_PORTR|nr:hypothetical protein [Portunus trituberculatus]